MNDAQFTAKAIILQAMKHQGGFPLEVAFVLVLAMVADGYLVMTREGDQMLVTLGEELPLELQAAANCLPC